MTPEQEKREKLLNELAKYADESSWGETFRQMWQEIKLRIKEFFEKMKKKASKNEG